MDVAAQRRSAGWLEAIRAAVDQWRMARACTCIAIATWLISMAAIDAKTRAVEMRLRMG
jgi:hypothetical protein